MLGSGDKPDPVVTGKDCTFGLEDVIITNVECNFDDCHIYPEFLRVKHYYPTCGTLTGRVHDYRMRAIKSTSGKKHPPATA